MGSLRLEKQQFYDTPDKAPISILLLFHINIKDMKKLNNEYSANVGRKTVEAVYFE
jgi:hypothetical protein